MIRNINIIWTRVAVVLITIIVIATAVGIVIFSTQEYPDNAESVILKQLDTAAVEGCYLQTEYGSCIAREEIGFIEKVEIDELCAKAGCSDPNEYRAVVESIIISSNQTNKKIYIIH